MPQPNEIYKHFKGNLYKVIAVAKHSETMEKMVVYQALYGDFDTYVRPFESFISEVDRNKYPDATQKMRFELVSAAVGAPVPSEVTVKEDAPVITEDEPVITETIKVYDEKPVSKATEDEGLILRPQVEAFLDADTVDERRNILVSIQNSVTQDEITIMATVMDIEIDTELDVATRYHQLLTCLDTKSRFETLRLR